MLRLARCRLLVLLMVVGLGGESALRADTVFLSNGSTIDGMVVGRKDGFVLVQIGNLGRMEIPDKDVERVEKNSRTGYVTPSGGSSRSGNPDSGTKTEPSPPESAPSDPPETDSTDTAVVETESVEAEDALDPEVEKQVKAWAYDLTRQRTTYRVRAERRLSKVGPGVIPHLLPLTHHASDLTRIAVFRIFKSVGGDAAIEPCLLAFEDDNPFVRKLAWEALKKITGKRYRFPWEEKASAREREKATRRWREWWEAEQQRRARREESADAEETSPQ